MIAQSPDGTSTGYDRGTVLFRPWTCPVAARGGPDPGGQWCAGTQLDERTGRPRVVGEPSAAQDDVGPRALHGAPLDLRPPRREQRVARLQVGRTGRVIESQRVGRGLHDGLPSGATAQVGPQRPLDVRRVGGDPVSLPPRAASRMMMPGVQKPHWLAPAATKADDQRSRTAGGAPSSVVTARPATRRTGVTQATLGRPSTQTVQHPHWPCGLQPSLTEKQPNSSRSASRREIPSATDASDPFRLKRRPRRGRFGRRVSAAGPTGSGAGIAQEGECPVRPRLS